MPFKTGKIMKNKELESVPDQRGLGRDDSSRQCGILPGLGPGRRKGLSGKNW